MYNKKNNNRRVRAKNSLTGRWVKLLKNIKKIIDQVNLKLCN